MRPYSAPFYFNIKFYTPSPINKQKNAAHIRYIATRPGADRGEIESENELFPGTPAHHLKYAHERPRSHGLFGQGNEEIILADVQKELIKHNGMAWRIIISLHPEDANRLDFEGRDAWRDTIKSQMSSVAEQMGISESNLVWYAAYHPEKDHPHAHIIFWEKNPKRRLGKVSPFVKDQMRKKFVQHIYKADRDRYGKEKTALRELIRERGVSNLKDAVRLAREFKEAGNEVNQLQDLAEQNNDFNLHNRLDKEQIETLISKLQGIVPHLPGKGRLMLKFMPPHTKSEILKVARWLYEQQQFKPLRQEYEQVSETLARPYSQQTDKLSKAVEKARVDMIERMGQTVLRAAAELSKPNQFLIYPDRAAEAVRIFRGASGKVVNQQPEKLTLEIMKRLHNARLSQEDSRIILTEIGLAKHVNPAYIEQLFQKDVSVPKATKEVLFLMKEVFGEGKASEIGKSAEFSEEEMKELSLVQKTSRELKQLAQLFRIKDDRLFTAEQMSKLLMISGVPTEETKTIVLDWISRSGTELTNEEITPIIEKVEKVFQDSKEWGRDLRISNRDFKQLINNLQVKAPNPWRPDYQRQRVEQGHRITLAQNTFHRAIRQLAKAVKRGEAEREYERRKLLKKLISSQEREGDEQERDKHRGR